MQFLHHTVYFVAIWPSQVPAINVHFYVRHMRIRSPAIYESASTLLMSDDASSCQLALRILLKLTAMLLQNILP